MFVSRIILYFMLIFLLMNSYCSCQHEIRKAVQTKTNRKVNEGRENVQYVKDKARESIDRTNAKIDQKKQNAIRKTNAIKDVINS